MNKKPVYITEKSPLGYGVKSARETLERTARAFKLSGIINNHMVFVKWREIVGPRLYEACRAERLTGDTLTVRVTDSVWGQELRGLTGELLARIAEVTGSTDIKKLRFKTGPVDPPAARPGPLEPLPDMEEEQTELERQLAATPLGRHPELCRVLAGVWCNSRRLLARKKGETS